MGPSGIMHVPLAGGQHGCVGVTEDGIGQNLKDHPAQAGGGDHEGH
jgi:hypothetical protein